jgi:DNA polymerase-3 subunit delta
MAVRSAGDTLAGELAKGKIAPVYLLYGEETFLKEDAARRIREAVLGTSDPSGAWNLNILEGGVSSLFEILDAARTLPMFASRRLVWVKDVERLRETEGEALQAYIEAPADQSCLLLTAGSGRPDFRKSIFRILQRSAKVIEFSPLKKAEAARWIRSRARALGADIDDASISLLELQVGSDLFRLDQEMRKAMDFAGPPGRITPEVLSETLGTAAAGSLFELAERAAAGQIEEAVALLRRILGEGEEPPRVLFLLARQVRTLILGRSLLRAGTRGKDLALALGIPPYPFLIEKVEKQIRAFPEASGERAVRLLLRADRALKGGIGRPERVLEGLVLDLASVVGKTRSAGAVP